MEEKKVKKKANGWAIAAFIVALVAVVLSFIPIINNAAFVLGGIAVALGIVGLVTKSAKAMPIIGMALGIIAIVITLSMQSSMSKAIDEASNEFDKITGDKTEEVLKEDVNIEIGQYYYATNEYGIPDSKLDLVVTNKSDKRKSFNFTIEALDANGNRIATDFVYANDVAPGQSINCEAFTLVTSDEGVALQNATFTVIEASEF